MERTVEDRIRQFPAAELAFDENLLSDTDRQVLKKLVEASCYMDDIFLVQVSPRNPEWMAELAAAGGVEDDPLPHYFHIMMGPWDRIDGHKPFMDVGDKPLGAGFYPADLTRDEFEGWLAEHPEDRESFTSYYTTIRREANRLVSVPYSTAYKEFLEPAARLLEEAAGVTDSASLARFLRSRAAAFRSDDYFQSELDWMDITDSVIDVTIGPYEVYEDRLLAYKAAFEAVIGIKDPEESAQLETFTRYLAEMEENLPGAGEYESLERGGLSPISVVSEVFCAGEIRAGVQTTAFVLPNDEHVRKAKGSKKVMLKNVAQAKFQASALPIAERVWARELLPLLHFEDYFKLSLMHELAHSMGPGLIRVADGRETTVALVLKDLYPGIEEMKAELAGMCSCLYLADKGLISGRERVGVSYVTAQFRQARFGAVEAHAQAALAQLNFLLEREAVVYDENSRRFSLDFDKLSEAVRELTRQVLMLQAAGDYQGVKNLLDRYGVLTPLVRRVLGDLGDIPVDIEPVFPLVAKMQGWQ